MSDLGFNVLVLRVQSSQLSFVAVGFSEAEFGWELLDLVVDV